MFNLLQQFLLGRTTPESVDALVNLDEALTDVGFDAHQDEIDRMITNESYDDREALVPTVEAILRVGADTLLVGFKVTIDATTPLPMVSALVTTLGGFQIADDVDRLNAILQSDYAPDEMLLEILELRTQWTAEDWMPFILAVGPQVIEEMKKLVAQHEELQEVIEPVDPAIAQRVHWFHAQEEEALSRMAMDEGTPLGLSMEHLYNCYSPHLLDQPTEKSIRDLVSLSLMSNTSMEAIEDETQFFLEDLYPTLEDNQKATRLLRKELERLNQFGGHRDA